MKRYYYLTGIFVFLLLSGIYYHLGGFTKITVEKPEYSNVTQINIWGKGFKGDIQDAAWESLFTQIRNLIEKKELKEPVTVVYFRETDGTNQGKNIDAFIGTPAVAGFIPQEGFSREIMTFKGVLRVKLLMHPVVMPSPGKVKNRITRYAAMNNLKLDSLLIEKYYHDNSLIVEVPFH